MGTGTIHSACLSFEHDGEDSEKEASAKNPYYDSTFLISLADDEKDERRYLVELYEDELLELKAEIDTILKKRGI